MSVIACGCWKSTSTKRSFCLRAWSSQSFLLSLGLSS